MRYFVFVPQNCKQGMANIKIPSPSAILDPPLSSSSLPSSTTTISAATVASSSVPSLPPPSTSNAAAGQPPTTKPKQSKSRNGCITCKTKRLKCDESKPTCLQCERRKVQCGGYKRDFKWRPFEETNAANKTAAKTKKPNANPPPPPAAAAAAAAAPPPVTPHRKQRRTSVPTVSRTASATAGPDRRPSMQEGRQGSSPSTCKEGSSAGDRVRHREPGPSLPSLGLGKQTGQPNPNVETQTLGAHTPDSSAFGDLELPGPTPWLSDLFPSSTDGDGDGDGNALSLEWGSSPSKSDTFSFSALLTGDDETSTDPWLVPPDVSLSSLADGSVLPDCITNMLNETSSDDPGVVSSDVLAQRFDRITCGILSVKDGTYENPWRTLIWPLAKDTPALYHALVSLAAFHSCKTNPEYRVHGVDHMRKSIKHMVQDIQNMRTDAALATSLALAFADTWDQHTHSCIQHLRGAKALVSQLLDQTVQGNVCGVDLERVRFLYNTWLYMDVTARLTSRDGSESPEMDMSVFNLPGDAVHEVDPLMGCAATLFPLLNRVAGLVQRVRKSDSNSISLVSQAIELKRLVEQWEPPQWFEPPEDPSSEVQHSIQTAHACRWATLLYLHQAVPEMPSEPTSELAKRVLILLATVPPSSRTIVIQKFPLLAAGCEAEQDEDREWVLSRWMSIQSRLMLGSVDKCIEVIQEVWARRDAFQAAAAVQGQPNEHKRSLSGGAAARGRDIYSPPEPWKKDRVVSTATSRQSPRRGSAVTGLENIEYEKTVRGRLHWINVMEQWGWEVFLG